MTLYSKVSKIVLLPISVIIVLISIFLSKYDTWVIDLFYSLTLFSLIIIIDFLFYELYCPSSNGRNHRAFCLFPIYRIKVLIFEIKCYLRRGEILVLLMSILFYISYFYLNNNVRIIPLVVVLLLYIMQFIYLICFIFIIKNFQSNKTFRVSIKNFVSLFISISILLTILAEKSKIARQIFYLNPFSGGFLSFLMSKGLGTISIIIIFCQTIFLSFIVHKKFKEWPL
jgi:hypothetical protein